MIYKDEANKYKSHLNQLYKEIDSYKSSLHSYELHCDKLKRLNDELNKALSEERDLNSRGRDRVHDQMMRMSSKVNELEGFSMTMENSNRDINKKTDYIMNRLLELKEYLSGGEMHTSRTNGAPGTVRSNLSGMFSSCARNPMELNNTEENIDNITNDIKNKFDDLKGKVYNYQNAINKLQGEKQQMYQSMNQLKLEKSPVGFATPATKSTSVKKPNNGYNSTKDTDKAEVMIDYLRAEISHLRDKNKSIEQEFETYKSSTKNEKVKHNVTTLQLFMNEILRPGKDLIYQLCADPHLSESYFYKEDEKFEGMEPKFCLDIVKIFQMASESIVDLRSILDQKERVIAELDRSIIDLKVKFSKQDQISQQKADSQCNEYLLKVKECDNKCRELTSHFRQLAGELEKEKVKCERLESENRYLKDHIKHKVDSQQNQQILQENIESRVKIAREEGIRQGRREGIMDSKINEYIEKYKYEIEEQGEKIVQLEEYKEKLELECNRLKSDLSSAKQQILAERNLEQSLSKEIEMLKMEVNTLKHNNDDY